ncbi:MAG: phenylalanine--tRNA ligase subunit beta, partial [Dehalococcoidia bacterium]|nr:phenylalanine--tRNA ligase subunit beta [Dehalococcoidia bacterium]
ELLTYSLVGRDKLSQLSPGHRLSPEPLSIANPMSRDMEHLRTSLRASLLDALERNRRREQTPARVFELSRIYIPTEAGLPEERETLCAMLCGTAEPASWHHGERRVDFFDAKGAVELLLRKCGAEAAFVPSEDAGLFPGRQASVCIDGDVVGIIGQLHPAVARVFKVDPETLLFELDVARLMAHSRPVAEYEPLSRFPSSERDLALVVDEAVTYASVTEIVSSFGLVADTTLFDVYRGEQVPPGKKSFAVRIVFQAPDRTLTDAEVQGTLDKILARLGSRLGASLRS